MIVMIVTPAAHHRSYGFPSFMVTWISPPTLSSGAAEAKKPHTSARFFSTFTAWSG